MGDTVCPQGEGRSPPGRWLRGCRAGRGRCFSRGSAACGTFRPKDRERVPRALPPRAREHPFAPEATARRRRARWRTGSYRRVTAAKVERLPPGWRRGCSRRVCSGAISSPAPNRFPGLNEGVRGGGASRGGRPALSAALRHCSASPAAFFRSSSFSSALSAR
jgi:hypothetical protein